MNKDAAKTTKNLNGRIEARVGEENAGEVTKRDGVTQRQRHNTMVFWVRFRINVIQIIQINGKLGGFRVVSSHIFYKFVQILREGIQEEAQRVEESLSERYEMQCKTQSNTRLKVKHVKKSTYTKVVQFKFC